jgi:hypothetical protein
MMADEKSAYQVLSPLKVGEKRLDPVEGKIVKVDLTEDEAAELKALGVVGELPVKQSKEKATSKEPAKEPDKAGDPKGA